MAIQGDEKDDKSSAFDHDAEAEHLQRIGGDDDEDIEVNDEDEDNKDDDEPDDSDPADEAHQDREKAEGEDDDEEGEAAETDGKKAKGSKFQERVNRLTARTTDLEGENTILRQEIADRDGRLAYTERAGALTAKAAIDGEIANIEAEMAAAIEDGDTKKQVSLNTKLTAKVMDQGRVNGWLQRNPEPKPGEQPRGREVREQPQQQDRSGAARFKPAARPWYEQNKGWFDKPEMTVERAAVAELDTQLTKEGFEVDDPDRYREMNKRLYAKMPHLAPKKGGKDRQPRDRQQGRQRTAGADRDSGGATPTRRDGVTALTDSDKKLMRTFKLDPGNDTHVKEFHRQRKSQGR